MKTKILYTASHTFHKDKKTGTLFVLGEKGNNYISLSCNIEDIKLIKKGKSGEYNAEFEIPAETNIKSFTGCFKEPIEKIFN